MDEKMIHRALGGRRDYKPGDGSDGSKKKPTPTHTHGVHYERADNGGVRAHVTVHHGEGPHSEGHSHNEEHVLPDMEAAQAHMQEHMGDQPAVGEMPAPGEEQNPTDQEAAAAGGPQAA